MSRAVCTDIQYVEPGGCCRSRMVFRSVWDRLCQQLFGAIPPGMDTEDILPDVAIWDEGITLQEEEGGEFSFTVTTSSEEPPKAQDVILYKGKYYIVGEVEGQGGSSSDSPSGGSSQYQGNTDPGSSGAGGDHDITNPVNPGGGNTIHG